MSTSRRVMERSPRDLKLILDEFKKQWTQLSGDVDLFLREVESGTLEDDIATKVKTDSYRISILSSEIAVIMRRLNR
jgi:hypothetical protein